LGSGPQVATPLGVAFRLKPKESARKGLRRVLRQQIDAALAGLKENRPPGTALHPVRKHIKKARAVIALVDRDLHVGKVRARLRHAGRLLSPMRDADATTEEAQALCASRRAFSWKSYRALHQVLGVRKKRARESAKRHHAVALAKDALTRARRSIDKWPWTDVKRSQMIAAIQRSYKRARRGMSRAKAADDAATFHEWRKRVKAVWYALRLLEPIVPHLRRSIGQLEQVETLLGHDHNLFVLSKRAQDALGRVPNAERLLTAAMRRQARLRRMALRTGAALFKERPGAFGERLRTACPAT
jgi:hypothetical protein